MALACGRDRCGPAASARRPGRANVHQVFTPLIEPAAVGLGVAVTLTPATSEPKSGSVTATASMTSAGGQLRAASPASAPRCRPSTRARVRISGRVMSEPPTPSEPRDSSSVATTMPMYSDSPPLPKPPYSSGIDRPKRRSRPGPLMMLLGDVGVVRGGCARRSGLTFSSAKRRKVSWTSSKSSSRWRGPSWPASEARNSGVAVGGAEGAGAVEGAGLDAPLSLPAEEPGRPGRRRRRPRRRR